MSDELSQALRAAAKTSLARELELSTTGFETEAAYSLEFLRAAVAEGQIVNVTSKTTGAKYGCRLYPATLTERSVRVALVAIAGGMLQEGQYRKLTFVNDNGSLKVLAGWH